ncbi:MAG: ribosome silencing factor [Christensenellales bacterium]|jgi:ribosome-associated protein
MQSDNQLAKRIAAILEDKKGLDIVTLDISQMTIIADAFVVASGGSGIQVRALTDAVAETLEEESSLRPARIEGYEQARWVVLDYGDVIVHIFHQEERGFYNLERLWMEEHNFTFHPSQAQGGE